MRMETVYSFKKFTCVHISYRSSLLTLDLVNKPTTLTLLTLMETYFIFFPGSTLLSRNNIYISTSFPLLLLLLLLLLLVVVVIVIVTILALVLLMHHTKKTELNYNTSIELIIKT
jgi:hypothetical protein